VFSKSILRQGIYNVMEIGLKAFDLDLLFEHAFDLDLPTEVGFL